MQSDSHLAEQYVQIVSEVIGLYRQKLVELEKTEQTENDVFSGVLEKIVVALEGLVAGDEVGTVPLARALPATRHLSSLQNLPISKSVSPIVNLLANLKDDILWQQNPNYNDDLLGKGYMDNYCHCQFVGKKGFYYHPDILLGIYIQGDNLYYPDHNHPAQEVYVVLSGCAKWRQSKDVGGGEWQDKPSGEFIFHDSNEYHAMSTLVEPTISESTVTESTIFESTESKKAEPLIALYAWHGAIDVDAMLT